VTASGAGCKNTKRKLLGSGKSMPYKFNDGRRRKIPKAKYRVTNWPDYDAALVRRGSLTVWVTEEAVAAWHAPVTGRRGGQPVYSDLAIETGLALRLVLHQPLRQTEGALRSIADLLDVEIRIPDHTTFSRRGGGLMISPKRIERNEPLHLLVDSTGIKIYGEGEWLDQKHGVRSCRRWRKLHLAVDADTHEIAAVELTPDDVGDVSAVADLLDQIDGSVGSMTGDGAYDGEVVYDAVAKRHPEATVIIPPRSTAVSSKGPATQRDKHLETIARHGRIGWQRSSGYSRRSLVETAMYRYKTIIGRRLHARNLPNQKTEAKIGCNVLNRMTSLGMPVAVRVK
jgi:hypothetical protein